jgi:hypothetical protein
VENIYMEHRWSTRKVVTGSVVVECPRIGLVPAVMRDVSLGGMAVEAQVGSLPLNAPVAVVFDLPSGERSDAYCLPAMVVRRMQGGVGIMFLEPDAEVLRSMRAALYGPASDRVSVSAA